MVLDVLSDPEGFVARRADAPGFRGPVAVALLAGVAGLVASVPSVSFAVGAMPPEAGAFGAIAYVTAAVGALVGPFVRWGLYAVAFFAVASVAFDPEGTFRDLLALSGWGLVPAIPGGLVGGLFSYLVFADATPPSDPAAMAAFARGLRSSPTLVVAGLVGLVFLAWSALIWTFAVRHSLALSLRESLVVVGVPVGIAALWRLYSVFGGGFP